jgi:hypothetical protein
MFGLGVNSDAGFTGSIVLNERNPDFLVYWDSVMPNSPLLFDTKGTLCEPSPGRAGQALFLFTGAVPPGRKLVSKQAPLEKCAAPPADYNPVRPQLWALFCQGAELQAELERQAQEEKQAQERGTPGQFQFWIGFTR